MSIDIDSDIFSHPNRDPGVFHEAGRFLAVFAQQYEHALVLIDAEWEGSPASAEEIEKKIQDDLNRNGWEGRSAVIVIDPDSKSGYGVSHVMCPNYSEWIGRR